MSIVSVYEAVKAVVAIPTTAIVAVTALVAPATPSATPVGTGGSFAAGTYFWKVTATNALGETLGSTEVTAAIVLNGSATIGWAVSTGATGYRVYRTTTTGAENVSPALVGVVGSGATVTFTDTGAAPTAGAVPAANTSGNPAATGASFTLVQTHENYRSLEVVVLTGGITDGTYTIVVQESADNATWVPVPAARLEGATPPFTSASANSVIELGVFPDPYNSLYMRVRITATGVTSGGTVSALCLMGFGSTLPVVRP